MSKTDISTVFDKAMSLVNSGDFTKAFEAFSDITQNQYCEIETRSDAFNMMGALILFDPALCTDDDESGSGFFAQSVELNPGNNNALLNIIGGFGLSVNSHKNIKLFDDAIAQLRENNPVLSLQDEQMIAQRTALRNNLIRNQQSK